MLRASAPMNDTANPASSKLQKMMRRMLHNSSIKVLVNDFKRLQFTNEKFETMSFDNFLAAIRSKPVLKIFKRLIFRIMGKSTLNREVAAIIGDNNNLPVVITINARALLAAYMIHYYPMHVFENGVLETEVALVKRAASDFITMLNSMVDDLSNSGWTNITRMHAIEFHRMVCTYTRAFNAWKVPDQAQLTARLERALTALFVIRNNVLAVNNNQSIIRIDAIIPASGDDLAYVNASIDRLRAKYVQVNGQQALADFEASLGAH